MRRWPPQPLGVGGVCLLMIVRNEAHCIKRCLDSVKDHINTWSIVDTGSTDDTPAIICREMAGIPGHLHFRPWVDFGHNRTEAYRLAPVCDWYLLIDADETFHGEIRKDWLVRRGYSAMVRLPGKTFPRATLIPSGIDWQWVGRVDERIEPNPTGFPILEGCMIQSHSDGGRHIGDWIKKDLAQLELDFQDDPDPRTAFHIAQRYELDGNFRHAMAWYLKRAGMKDGWQEEVFVSLQRAMGIADQLGYGDLAEQIQGQIALLRPPDLLKWV